jgi:hypothetical protein
MALAGEAGMRLGKKIVVLSLLLWFVLGVGVPAGLAQSAGGPRLAVQLDGLFYYRGESASFSSTAFSPFLAFELGILPRLSLRIGLGPPLGDQPGQQAFATNIALHTWLGRGQDFLETGLGSYYQNTWCNGMPDYRAYALYLGWRHVAKSAVIRFGGIVGLSSEGKMVIGIGFGFGRSIGSRFY